MEWIDIAWVSFCAVGMVVVAVAEVARNRKREGKLKTRIAILEHQMSEIESPDMGPVLIRLAVLEAKLKRMEE